MKLIEGGKITQEQFSIKDRSMPFWYWINNVAFPVALRDIWAISFEESTRHQTLFEVKNDTLQMQAYSATIQADNFLTLVSRKQKLEAINILAERIVCCTGQSNPCNLPKSNGVVVLPKLNIKQPINQRSAMLLLKQAEKMAVVASQISGRSREKLMTLMGSLPGIPSEFIH